MMLRFVGVGGSHKIGGNWKHTPESITANDDSHHNRDALRAAVVVTPVPFPHVISPLQSRLTRW
jgi:hypothetical protein